jgi:hypothetical protein
MLARVANRLWHLSTGRSLRRFEAALDRPDTVQRALLREIVAGNADTAFGRAHHFDRVDSPESFRRHVPLTTWDDYAPLVERIRGGEQNVLTRDLVRRLIPSSGSTAAAKLIPYTRVLQRQFSAAIGPWIADLYRRRPDLTNGPAFWSITPVERAEAGRSAVPIGFDEDSAYLGAILKPLVDATLAVPASVGRIHDIVRFRRRTLFHLLRARDLRLISVWHPSFLTLLLDAMEKDWRRLLAMFARRRLRRRLNELAQLAPTDYHRIWPHLGLISAWGDAHAALHLDALRRRLPGVPIQPKGLLATEAFVTIPFADHHPLALRSHVFEFLDDDNRPHFAHQLERDATYRVVVTTAGGLYRYQLNDRVRVTSRLGATPSLRFLGKEDHVSDRFGEKLSEGFVAATLRDLLTRHKIQPAFAMLAPQDNRYVLYLESARLIPPADLDAALSANPHYAYCRSLGQLAVPAVVRLAPGAYAAYTARLVSLGQRLGNIKPTALSTLDNWDAQFSPVIDPRPHPVNNPPP